MRARIIIAALLLVALVASHWAVWKWAEARTEASAAEARTKAVDEARKEARRQMQEDIEEARARATAHAERVEKLQARVREQQQTVEKYAQSEQGQRECFGDEGVERFNAL